MEQDSPLVAVNDELPTYDDLAAQQGPNSRFGRWKDWVEKRAAERYAEDTPERRQARRMKGWGPHVDTQPHDSEPLPSPPLSPTDLGRTQTVLCNSSPPECDPKAASSTLYTTRNQALPPSHLKLCSFGSRFLPHAELPILTLLPLFNDTKLLIGHANGLSVLDLNPDAPLSELGSHESQRRDIWHGEGVYQLALLEYEQLSMNGTPQGVILALVGAELPDGGSEKDSKENHRSIRMYNLSSLASITSWATASKDHEPLNLGRPCNWELQQSQKKHKQQRNVSRGLKSHKVDSTSTVLYDPEIRPPPPPKDAPRCTPIISPSPSLGEAHTPIQLQQAHNRPNSADTDWEVVVHDDLPLRWATDYVPLASPNSKLATQSVLFFELHRCPGRGRITARLAIVTKQNVLFYESVRGERAFRFVKEFYTPLPARSARFVYQSTHEPRTHLSASASLVLPRFTTFTSSSRGHSPPSSSRRASWIGEPSVAFQGGGQLSLFLVFEKKAGLIRISDSSVGEIELWEEPGGQPKSTFRRSITHLESLATKDWKGTWAPPAEITLPLTPVLSPNCQSLIQSRETTVGVYFLTRGKRTHILPSPLPMPLISQAPLKVLKWGVQPTQVVPRACERPKSAEPFLQVTALSEDGVEVQEFSLAFLTQTKGKEKQQEDTVVVWAEVGLGGAGFLCMGGHWNELDVGRTMGPLQRNVSTSSTDTVDFSKKRTREQGFYAWTQKGYDDWRVFWLGGDSNDEAPPQSP